MQDYRSTGVAHPALPWFAAGVMLDTYAGFAARTHLPARRSHSPGRDEIAPSGHGKAQEQIHYTGRRLCRFAVQGVGCVVVPRSLVGLLPPAPPPGFRVMTGRCAGP